MDPEAPERKRPRLSTTWPAVRTHDGVSILHHSPASPVFSPRQSSFPRPPDTHLTGPSTAPPASPVPLTTTGPPTPTLHLPPPRSHHLQHQPHHPPPPQQSQPQPTLPPPLPQSQPHQPPPPLPLHPVTHVDNRHHHEPDRFPPPIPRPRPSAMTSPATPYFPRDHMAKPEPNDMDAYPSRQRRPSSNGTLSEEPVAMAHALPPQTHNPDDRPVAVYENGPPPPSTPFFHWQSGYPPPTPIPPQPGFEVQQHNNPPPADPSYPLPVAATASTSKRKAQRASQACDSCRSLKAKCDDTKPCKSCVEKGVPCIYRDPAPKAQDKAAADILYSLNQLSNKMMIEFGRFNSRMTAIENHLRLKQDSPQLSNPVKHEAAADEGHSSINNYDMQHQDNNQENNHEASLSVPHTVANEEETEDLEPGPIMVPGKPTIPDGHTTLAASLLEWGSIRKLVGSVLESEIKFVKEFPIRPEQRRGLLRLYGRGEGSDSLARDKDPDCGTMEIVDDESAASVRSPADYRGYCLVGPHTPQSEADCGAASATSSMGIRWDFSPDKVWSYAQSYKDHIQNMHPLIPPSELDAMVRKLLDEAAQLVAKSPRAAASRTASISASFSGASFAAAPGAGLSSAAAPKRKRTSSPPGLEISESPAQPHRIFIARSAQNAVVLLVLALGKICLWRHDKIPNVVAATASDAPVNDASPVLPPCSPPSSSGLGGRSGSLPSPHERVDMQYSSRQVDGGSHNESTKTLSPTKKNLDVIPGLDYFASATDILGGQVAGASLRHVQAFILAGLYHGQLGRVLESFSYVTLASHSVLALLRTSFSRYQELRKKNDMTSDKRDNQKLFAFWTCLQLESDIIAELPLTPSGILSYEEYVPYPNVPLAVTCGFDIRVLNSYMAQLYLRKSLNKIHDILYHPNARPPTIETVEGLRAQLDMRFVPPEFKFSEEDPPASDILSARLRAKYWGAQVITHRLFIRQILEYNHLIHDAKAAGNMGERGEIRGHDPSNPQSMLEKPDTQVIIQARKGVRALIESTRAFHGLEDKRFVVTNVFGTSTAQWGNLITLSAIYLDPTLTYYVDTVTLKNLFSRTIEFFKAIAHPSSALAIQLRVLQSLVKKLWHPPPASNVGTPAPATAAPIDQLHADSSFSSTMSYGVVHVPVTSGHPLTSSLGGGEANHAEACASPPPPPGERPVGAARAVGIMH